MKEIWLLAATTYKEGIRNRILLGILLCAILLCVFNLVFTNMFSHELSKVTVDAGLSVISISGLMTIFFMGMNLMAKDLDKRTIYMVLARPISRSQYVLGKFLGISLLVVTAVLLLGIVATGSVKLTMLNAPDYIPPHFSWTKFMTAVFALTLSLLIIVSLAILFTVLTSSSFLAVLMTISTYLIGQNAEAVRRLVLQTSSEAMYTFKKAIIIISWLFPNLEAFNLKTAAAYGLVIDKEALLWSFLHGVSYIGLILIIAVVLFNRRELT
ncbi:MAG: ABC transporter permease [Desulfobacteraceae bacterium]|jgi:ABC-type transport system involved in multi-copper enzyme maturation permease subunit|nr:MAG: ABC transporter permease [Desulfobacteraceae bacterium]